MLGYDLKADPGRVREVWRDATRRNQSADPDVKGSKYRIVIDGVAYRFLGVVPQEWAEQHRAQAKRIARKSRQA